MHTDKEENLRTVRINPGVEIFLPRSVIAVREARRSHERLSTAEDTGT